MIIVNSRSRNASILSLLPSLVWLFSAAVNGFSVVGVQNHRLPTRLFLKDSIAEMIDKELLRLENRNKHEEEIKTKTQKFMQEVQPLPSNYDYNGDFEDSTPTIVKRRDVKMAHDDPQRYCADRCVSTGNCDVFEDLYSLTPQEVLSFCKDCVLSDEEEACDVPDAMYEGLSP